MRYTRALAGWLAAVLLAAQFSCLPAAAAEIARADGMTSAAEAAGPEESAAAEVSEPEESAAAEASEPQEAEESGAETEQTEPEEETDSDSGVCGENLTWTLDGEGTLTISGTGATDDWDAADQTPWYALRDRIVKVAVTDGVTGIGAFAFAAYPALAEAALPESLTSVGASAFESCAALNTVTIPSGLTEIGRRAFYDTPWYQSVAQDGCAVINGCLLDYLGDAETVTVPDGVTSIGDYAFAGNTKLTGVTIPDSVTKLGAGAFLDCTGLSTVTVPGSVTEIGSYALGYVSDDAEVTAIQDFVILGYSDSTAQRYAQENGFAFGALDQKPATPELKKAENVCGGVKVTWSAVPGAERYQLWRKVSGGKWEKIGSPVTGTSLTDQTVSSGVTYVYTVRAIRGSTQSGYDSTGKMICYLAAPSLKQAENANGGVKVTWSAVTGAKQYQLWRKISGGKWEKVGSPVTGTSLTDQTASSGVTYTYTVRAICGSTQSGYSSTGKTVSYLAAPTLKKAENVYGGVKVTWSAVTGAKQYQLWRKISGGKWEKVGSPVTGTSLTDQAVSSGVTYIYTVRAICGGTQSGFDSTGVTVLCLSAPALKKTENADGGVKVTWSAVTGAKQYQLWRKTSGGSWSKVGSPVTGTSLTDQTASSGVTYTYTVRAICGSTQSGYSSAGKTIYYLAAPELSGASANVDQIQVTWSAVTGAERYQVYRKTSGGSWTRLGSVTTTSFADTTAIVNTAYTYTVRAVRGTVLSGYDSAGVTENLGVKLYSFSSSYQSGSYYQKLLSVSIGASQRANIVAVAKSQVGYTEGNSSSALSGNAGGGGNYTEFGRWYYRYVSSGDVYYKGAWCSMFVSWCANEAGISSDVVPRKALVAYMKDAFSAQGRYYTWSQSECGGGSQTIQSGDFIIYSATPSGRYNHIGLVTGVSYSDGKVSITTVEGNVDDTCVIRHWVLSVSGSGKIDASHYIRGFCCPNYSS